MVEARFATHEWRRLSPWSIAHFGWKAIVQNLQALVFVGPATYGASRWGTGELAWIIPLCAIVAVLIGASITYLFYSYRVLDDSIQVRRGALFRKHLSLPFRRIQNVSIEHPFYFRPLGRVTLKIDGAGAKGEEVSIAALELAPAETARDHIVRRKRALDPKAASRQAALDAKAAAATRDPVLPHVAVHSPALPHAATRDPALPDSRAAFFRRSLADLIVHGLTNNRSFVVIAAALGFLGQSDFSPAVLLGRLGIDFDVVIAGLSLVRLAVLFVVALLAVLGLIALLSVLVSIFTYYGFSLYRSADGLTVKRGLLTKHEIHVRKSRIQTITLRQDWLDRLLGRRNIILERISHTRAEDDPWAAQKRRIFIPSVREHETATVTDEILPRCRVDELAFTPIEIRYFYKHAAIASAFYVAAMAASLLLPDAMRWTTLALLAVWPLHVLHLYLSFRRGGLAVDGDLIVVRSGTIGVDYRLFLAEKVQDVTHIQSILMRRHDVSTLKFHTASSTIKVPYMRSRFMRAVVDYCVFRAESTQRSWM